MEPPQQQLGACINRPRMRQVDLPAFPNLSPPASPRLGTRVLMTRSFGILPVIRPRLATQVCRSISRTLVSKTSNQGASPCRSANKHRNKRIEYDYNTSNYVLVHKIRRNRLCFCGAFDYKCCLVYCYTCCIWNKRALR